MKDDLRAKCETCKAPRGKPCRAVRVNAPAHVAAWIETGWRAEVRTHRARRARAAVLARRRWDRSTQ